MMIVELVEWKRIIVNKRYIYLCMWSQFNAFKMKTISLLRTFSFLFKSVLIAIGTNNKRK